MTGSGFARLEPGDIHDLWRALVDAKLPSDDLTEPDRAFFRLEGEASAEAFVGLEGTGDDRLLRSLVVLPDRRGAGVGLTVLTLVEEEARRSGVRRLHLLTTTAAGFFRANGYVDADRGAAPPMIASSREFTALCPASATYLVKVL